MPNAWRMNRFAALRAGDAARWAGTVRGCPLRSSALACVWWAPTVNFIDLPRGSRVSAISQSHRRTERVAAYGRGPATQPPSDAAAMVGPGERLEPHRQPDAQREAGPQRRDAAWVAAFMPLAACCQASRDSHAENKWFQKGQKADYALVLAVRGAFRRGFGIASTTLSDDLSVDRLRCAAVKRHARCRPKDRRSSIRNG
jgi:hypothetical protein